MLHASGARKNIRKHTFTLRVVGICKSLPQNVIDADNINVFKNHLDSCLRNQQMKYDYSADYSYKELRVH